MPLGEKNRQPPLAAWFVYYTTSYSVRRGVGRFKERR
jgi:hypothetical protein